jgi:hypothetical protein
VVENRAVRSISGPMKEEVTELWRNKMDGEKHYLNPSPNIMKVIKSRTMRWVGHVTHMGDEKCTQSSSRKTSREETTYKTEV